MSRRSNHVFVHGAPIASNDDACVCEDCLTPAELQRLGDDDVEVWEEYSDGWKASLTCERCKISIPVYVNANAVDANVLDGIDELRKLARISERTRESTFDGLTAEECVRLLRAVRACDWDIYADALTHDERMFAARTGRLSTECVARLARECA